METASCSTLATSCVMEDMVPRNMFVPMLSTIATPMVRSITMGCR
jgi:hypothetical protein